MEEQVYCDVIDDSPEPPELPPRDRKDSTSKYIGHSDSQNFCTSFQNIFTKKELALLIAVMFFAILSVVLLAILLKNQKESQFHCYSGSLAETLAAIFLGDNIEQYGIANGQEHPMTAVTVSFWMSLAKGYANSVVQPTMLSYGTSGHYNDFVVFVRRSTAVVWMSAFRSKNGIRITEGKLYHIAVMWKSSTGDYKMYKDGVAVFTLTDILRGNAIAGGGKWVIGQDQDSLGGGFQKKDSFKGEISDVNIWNKVLPPSEIKHLAKGCSSSVQGNSVSYDEFKFSNSTVMSKPSCYTD